LTILYRHPRRPDEAGMTVVADKAKAIAMKDQLAAFIHDEARQPRSFQAGATRA
jgi:hypothetical protein